MVKDLRKSACSTKRVGEISAARLPSVRQANRLNLIGGEDDVVAKRERNRIKYIARPMW